jgi:hypothetical protein
MLAGERDERYEEVYGIGGNGIGPRGMQQERPNGDGQRFQFANWE